MNAPNDNWPKHADGSNKRVDDMTADERRAVFKAARERFLADEEWVKAEMALVVMESVK